MSQNGTVISSSTTATADSATVTDNSTMLRPGIICPITSNPCGSICCGRIDQYCADPTHDLCCIVGWVAAHGKCCPRGAVDGKGRCCPLGQVNVGGICCHHGSINCGGKCCNGTCRLLPFDETLNVTALETPSKRDYVPPQVKKRATPLPGLCIHLPDGEICPHRYICERKITTL